MLNYPGRLQLIEGYSSFAQTFVDEGWRAYLFTFLFRPLGGRNRIAQMNNELERVYSTFLTRAVRKPLSQYHKDRLSVFIVAPDFPVKKDQKQQLNDLALNGGFHAHGIMLMPPKSRLKGSLVSHFSENKHLYESNRLLRLDVRAIDSNLHYVTDYVFKSVKHRKFDFDDVLILPRHTGTLRERTICL